MLRIPALAFFMRPFAVAGDFMRCLLIRVWVMNGKPRRNPALAAVISVVSGGQNMAWCMYFRRFSRYGIVCTLCAACCGGCGVFIVVCRATVGGVGRGLNRGDGGFTGRCHSPVALSRCPIRATWSCLSVTVHESAL